MTLFLAYLYIVFVVVFSVGVFAFGIESIIAVSRRQSPPLPSGARLRQVVSDQIAQYGSAKTVIDVGSGWGTMVRQIAREFPDKQVWGIERMFLPYIYSVVRNMFVKNAVLVRGDAFEKICSEDQHYDIGITYLQMNQMARLKEFRNRFDVLLVLDFPFVDLAPTQKIKLHHDLLGQHYLYIYDNR